VVREGKVIAERPRIVTPRYLSNLEGFSTDAGKYLDTLIRTYGSNIPGYSMPTAMSPGSLTLYPITCCR